MAPATLTFTTDNWATEQVLTVTGINDSAIDGSQAFTIALTASGDAVYAANAGEVVYSGRGIIGYGELIVIKHDDATLTAYGPGVRHQSG